MPTNESKLETQAQLNAYAKGRASAHLKNAAKHGWDEAAVNRAIQGVIKDEGPIDRAAAMFGHDRPAAQAEYLGALIEAGLIKPKTKARKRKTKAKA